MFIRSHEAVPRYLNLRVRRIDPAVAVRRNQRAVLELDRVPIATATRIGQARLGSGRVVASEIQRLNIFEKLV